jgi:hypothetical protein
MAVYAAAGAANDVEIVIPATFDLFWDNVRNDHHDVIVTDGTGYYTVNWDFSTWDYATKSAVIALDNVATAVAGMTVFWLYWGAADLDDETAFVPAGALTGRISFLSQQRNRVELAAELPGVAVPSQIIGKSTAEATFISWRVTPYLATTTLSMSDRRNYEEVVNVLAAAIDVETGGASQAAMFDITETEFVQDGNGDVWVLTKLEAGADATDYVCSLSVYCAAIDQYQTHEGRVLLKVRDTTE